MNPSEEEILFENAILEKVFNDDPECDWLGVTSWKMNQVTGMTGSQLIHHVKHVAENVDVVLYCPKKFPAYRMDNPWERYANPHNKNAQRMCDLMRMVDRAKILPVTLEGSPWVFNYRNYWIAKRDIFREFVEKWTIPVVQYFRDNNINLPIQYKGTQYPGQPFLMENLIGTFLANNPNIKHFQL